MNLSPYLFSVGQGTLISTQAFLNGNAPGYTGELITMGYPELTTLEVLSLRYGLDYCEVVPGLYNRGPGSSAHVGAEDLWGIAACSQKRAQDIDDYLTRYWGCYNVHAPRKKTFINWDMFEWKKPWNIFKHVVGRHFGMWAHVKLCAGRPINWFLRWRWAQDIKATAKGGSQDGIMHSYQSVLTYSARNQKCPMMDKAFEFWKARKIDVPGVYAAYIGDQNHPLVHAARVAQSIAGF